MSLPSICPFPSPSCKSICLTSPYLLSYPFPHSLCLSLFIKLPRLHRMPICSHFSFPLSLSLSDCFALWCRILCRYLMAERILVCARQVKGQTHRNRKLKRLLSLHHTELSDQEPSHLSTLKAHLHMFIIHKAYSQPLLWTLDTHEN